ncbi:Mpo1 family 2-hydroxy fatty acid dioxygenase [Oligoflexus tunisiensis]|uniref:Mpo1 family 2-hydroxy fatty acid dioxygenase n=1 Tax=Oligoflexus tunisiensis TaxID=708132 RepID=UPI000ACE545D|nr:Mpo1-like protein [Oligoflexus tunisiensis]
MKSLTDQLATYASYHRDRRNIGTHLIGIPMILFSIVLLLSRPLWMTDTVIPVTPALLASIVVGLYYLRLDIPLGLFMVIILVGMMKLSAPLAMGSTTTWLTWGISLFVVGWIFQTIGHIWEGKKPAFVDDVMGLIIGPLFVAAELVFALGGRPELHAEIENRVGKTRVGKKNVETR